MAPNFRIGRRAYGDAHMRFMGRARHLIDVTRSEMNTLAALSAEVRRLTERFLRSGSHRHSISDASPEAGTLRSQQDGSAPESAHAQRARRERRDLSPEELDATTSGVGLPRPDVTRTSASYRPASKLLRSRATMADMPPLPLGRSSAFRKFYHQGRVQTSERMKFASHLRPMHTDPTKISPRSKGNRSTNLSTSLAQPSPRDKSRASGNPSRNKSRIYEDDDLLAEEGGPLRADYVHGGVSLPLLCKTPVVNEGEKPIVIPGAEALSPRVSLYPPQESDSGFLAPLGPFQHTDLDVEEWGRFNRLRRLHLPPAREGMEGEEELTLIVPQRRNVAYRPVKKRAPREKNSKLPSILNIQLSTLQPSLRFDRFGLGPDAVFARDVAERARARTRVAFIRYEEVPHTPSMFPRDYCQVNHAPRLSNVTLPQFFDKDRTPSQRLVPFRDEDIYNPANGVPGKQGFVDRVGRENHLLNSSYGVQMGENFIASVGPQKTRDLHATEVGTSRTEPASNARSSFPDERLKTPRPLDMRALRLGLNVSFAEQEQGRTDMMAKPGGSKQSKMQKTSKSQQARMMQDATTPRGKNGNSNSIPMRHPRSTFNATLLRPKKVNYELSGGKPTDEDLVRLAELLYEYDMTEDSVGFVPPSDVHKSTAPPAAKQSSMDMEAANATWPASSFQLLPAVTVDSTSSRRSRGASEMSSQMPPLLLPLLDPSFGGKRQRPRHSLQMQRDSATPMFPEINDRSGSCQYDADIPMLRTYPFTPETSARARSQALRRIKLQNSAAKK